MIVAYAILTSWDSSTDTLSALHILINHKRQELEAVRDSVWYWPRSLLSSENLRTKLTATECDILSKNFVLYNGMYEFFDRMKEENWSNEKLREELIKEAHNARYWPRYHIHKILAPRKILDMYPDTDIFPGYEQVGRNDEPSFYESIHELWVTSHATWHGWSMETTI